MPPDLRVQSDAAIVLHLRRWLQQHPASVLGVYWPIRGEVDLRSYYAELQAAGIRLALPIVVDKMAPLEFAAWSPGEDVTIDRWGIATPVEAMRVAPDVLLVPCVGFNERRFRLGYGGGFYDRTLAGPSPPRAIGIAYGNARASFATEVHDIAMDLIITEAGPE